MQVLKSIGVFLDKFQSNPSTFREKAVWVGISAVLCLITSGVPLNWSALVVILKGERVYEHLCKTTAEGVVDCRDQDVRLNLIFTLCVAIYFSLAPALGFFMDSKGSRTMVILGVFLYLSGVFFYITSTADGFNGFFPAQILMNLGGPVIWSGLMAMSHLIPEKLPTISTILNTSYDASMIVFTLFNLIYHTTGASHNSMFTVLFALAASLGLYAIFRWPQGIGKYSSFSHHWPEDAETPVDSPAKWPVVVSMEHNEQNHHENNETKVKTEAEANGPSPNAASLSVSSEADIPLDQVELDQTKPNNSNPKQQDAATATTRSSSEPAPAVFESLSFVDQLKLPEYILFAIYHICYATWQMIYFGTAERRIASIVTDKADVDFYVSLFGWCLSGFFLVAPFLGHFIEKAGVPLTYVTVHASLLLWSFCILVKDIRFQVIGFVLFGLSRAIYCFGFGNYGRLYGLMQIAVGALGFLQNPLTDVVLYRFNGDWTVANLILLGNFLVLTIFPAFIFLRRRRYESASASLHVA